MNFSKCSGQEIMAVSEKQDTITKVTLVLLVWNEITGLKANFDAIPLDQVDEIIAVDGGSDDRSIEFLKEKNVTTYVQTVSGRGEAFRIAFEQANGDALIFFSPDGNEDPQDIPKFKPLLEAGADMVIASRMLPDARNEEDDDVLRFRKWANLTFTFLANKIWNRGSYLSDTINGFRAIRRSAWNRMLPNGCGYTIEYQCSIRAFKFGLKVSEFPTFEGNRVDDQKGSPSISTGLAFLRLLLSEFSSESS
jgi:glycosyltransferase involved in cell wall biosynthesis